MRGDRWGLLSIIMGVLALVLTSCGRKAQENHAPSQDATMNKKLNPVVYFEIPVADMARAVNFYEAVFGFTFEKAIIDSNEMALFPFEAEAAGVSGALAKGEVYKPTQDGVILYFRTESIDSTLQLALRHGGKVLYPKTSNGDLGFAAEFQDSEGNRIALHQRPDQHE